MKSVDCGLSWQFISAYDWAQASAIAMGTGGTLSSASCVSWYPTNTFKPGANPVASPYSQGRSQTIGTGGGGAKWAKQNN